MRSAPNDAPIVLPKSLQCETDRHTEAECAERDEHRVAQRLQTATRGHVSPGGVEVDDPLDAPMAIELLRVVKAKSPGCCRAISSARRTPPISSGPAAPPPRLLLALLLFSCTEINPQRPEVGCAGGLGGAVEYIRPPGDLEIGKTGGHDRSLELCFQQSAGNSTRPQFDIALGALRH